MIQDRGYTFYPGLWPSPGMAEPCDRMTKQPHSGCSHCTSRQDDCFLCISMLHYWSMTSTTMMCQLMTAGHINISSSSTGSCFQEARSSRHTIYSHNSLDSVSLPCPCGGVRAICTDQAAVVHNPLHRWVLLHYSLQQWHRQINNSVGQNPTLRQKTCLRHLGIPSWPTLLGWDRAPPHPICSASLAWD